MSDATEPLWLDDRAWLLDRRRVLSEELEAIDRRLASGGPVLGVERQSGSVWWWADA